MKVLLAVGSEQLSKNIADRYYELYNESITYKTIFYFDALVKEVREDKSYDIIVISEENMDQFKAKDNEQIDNEIFNYVDAVTDDIQDAEIIFIGSSRRSKGDKLVMRLFNIGVYNILLDNNRGIKNLCEMMKKPKTKREAKVYLQIDSGMVTDTGIMHDDEVDEAQMMNILNYYDRYSEQPDKWVEIFDNIAAQYSKLQLKVIMSWLPEQVRNKILEEPKYRFLMASDSFGVQENKNVPPVQQTIKKPSGKPFFGIFSNKSKDGNKKNGRVEEQRRANEKTMADSTEPVQKAVTDYIPALGLGEKLRQDQEQERLRQQAQKEEEERRRKELAEKAWADAANKSNNKTNQTENIPLDQLTDQAKQFAEAKAQAELAEQARREQEQKNQAALAEQARREQEQKNQAALAEQARKEQEQKNQAALAEQARREQEQKNQAALAEQARKEQEQKNQAALAEQARREQEQKNQAALAEQARREQEQRAEQERLKREAELNQKLNQTIDVEPIKIEQVPSSTQQVNIPKVEVPSQDSVLNAQLAAEQRKFREEQEKLAAEQEKVRQIQAQLEEERRRLRQEQEQMAGARSQIVATSSEVPQEARPYETTQIVPTDFKKIVTFVGANKAGTSFMVNAVAHEESNRKIVTSILDMTRDRSMYFIYNQSDKTLRKIAAECMNRLSEGEDIYLPVNKFLKVYTTVPGGIADSRRGYKHKMILETAKNNNNLTIIDADFTSPIDYFEQASEIYLVQDMDILKMQDATNFLREMKNRNIDLGKVRIIVNKYVKNSLTPKKIAEGLAYYKDPEMAFTDSLLPSRVEVYEIPYNINNYVKYTECLYKGSMNFKGYSADFTDAISALATQVYRQANPKKGRGLFG